MVAQRWGCFGRLLGMGRPSVSSCSSLAVASSGADEFIELSAVHADTRASVATARADSMSIGEPLAIAGDIRQARPPVLDVHCLKHVDF